MDRYEIGGVTYIAREDAEKPLAGYHGTMYSHYSVSFGMAAA